MTLDDFFADKPDARRLFETVAQKVERLGDTSLKISKSQIAFRRRRNFATLWTPASYLKGADVAPLVLTLSFPERDSSPRWKEVTKVSAKRYTHHLELRRLKDIDKQVGAWLKAAWEAA